MAAVRIGNVIIGLGAALVLIGVMVRLGWFGWFGKLPGDVRVEGERTSVFIPITSMILISVVGSIALNLFLRLFRGD